MLHGHIAWPTDENAPTGNQCTDYKGSSRADQHNQQSLKKR
nr:MAG TPA: hypothetical protein [Microviridae sp.]